MADLTSIKVEFELLRSIVDERTCRLWAATKANALGYGGESRVAKATGISRATIHRGKQELEHLESAPMETIQPIHSIHGQGGRRQEYRVRRPGGGRKLTEEKDPTIVAALERMLTDETAGDPMTEQKWIRSSLRHLSKRLEVEGHQASTVTVSRLLKDMGFSLKAIQRKQGRPGCPERDQQFQYIASQRQRFIAAGWPVISVDTKKKELIGEFRSNGRIWCKEAEEVNEHDFPDAAECRAVPFGLYDVAKNEGYVYVGVLNNTPEFNVTSIGRWWTEEGRVVYPGATELLILADSGGANGCRSKAWKLHLQEKVCDRHGLTVTVAHYPTGCSKWNPVEHRLFSQISINWAGKPLKTLSIMLGYIRGTTTTKGLKVKANLDENLYQKGQKVTREDMEQISLVMHAICPKWNYTLSSRK
jgi:hypothetical protein